MLRDVDERIFELTSHDKETAYNAAQEFSQPNIGSRRIYYSPRRGYELNDYVNWIRFADSVARSTYLRGEQLAYLTNESHLFYGDLDIEYSEFLDTFIVKRKNHHNNAIAFCYNFLAMTCVKLFEESG